MTGLLTASSLHESPHTHQAGKHPRSLLVQAHDCQRAQNRAGEINSVVSWVAVSWEVHSGQCMLLLLQAHTEHMREASLGVDIQQAP